VQQEGNWQWVGSVLLEARGMRAAFPPVTLRELQLAQDELDNRAACAQLIAALASGAVMGPVGHVDLAAISVAGLDSAVAYARSLGVKSPEATALVDTALAVRGLRAAAQAEDWPGAGRLLAALAGVTLTGAAVEDELRLIKANVDNHAALTALHAAAASGGPSGVLGEWTPAGIDVSALDAAIDLTMALGCHTPDAKAALVSAVISRRLRAGLVGEEWPFVAQVRALTRGAPSRGRGG
jgi:hypothetical protein